MESFLFVFGIVLSIIFVILVFGWSVKRKHNDVMDDIYEQEMWKDAQ